MVFAAGLLVLFVGLGLLVPGEIPVGKDKKITPRAARGAGAVLVFFLPTAIVMDFLWRRNNWERESPLQTAQWVAFGLLFTISLGILLWSLFGANKSAPYRPASKPNLAFEEVPDEPATPANENFSAAEVELPRTEPPRPPARKKASGKALKNDDPFNFG